MGQSHKSVPLAGKPTISVIIPTLNEAKNLPLVLPYIPMDVVDEVILVDGRSKDNTTRIARQLLPSIRIVLETKPGKGAALRRGYAESTGDILVVLDADGSHDPREIPRFIRALLEGADFVKGSRFAPAGGTTDMPRLRMAGNWTLTKLVNLLFAQSFTDLCYGYHAFWRYCLEYLDLEPVDGFEIDTSIYLQAVRNKMKVIEVPSFEGLRFYGSGKLQTFPDGWRVLRTIFRELGASRRALTAYPQPGFRSNILRSISNQGAIPVTGGNWKDVDQTNSIDCVEEREMCSLQEFFTDYLKRSPRECIQTILSAVLLDVIERCGASSGGLIVIEDELNQSIGFQVFGRTPEMIPAEGLQAMLEKGVASWAIQNRKPVLIQDTSQDSRWLLKPWEHEEAISRSAMVVPFFRHEHAISVIILTRPVDRSFSESELRNLSGMKIYL